MRHWSAGFIGVPFLARGRDHAGCDCFGLVYLVYRDVLGITLASYVEAYASTEERAEIAALIAGDASAWPWTSVPAGREREFDVALFRRGGLDSHIGIVAARGRMLHVEDGGQSCIETYGNGKWHARLAGFYRHAQR
jgi:cell wall-associated NlpC family hydrolase